MTNLNLILPIFAPHLAPTMSSSVSIERGLNIKREAVRFTGSRLLTLSFQTLGIIYSDIGTSPLYVLNGIWPPNGPMPSNEDIIGGLSAIVWSLTLLPLLKYTFISLSFGTHEGEGGPFALFQGLYPPSDIDYDEDRTLTGISLEKDGSPKAVKTVKQRLRWPLLLLCLFATSLTMADGILTPAVSVTSAVAGIGVAQPSIINSIVPVSIAFLLLLFFVQQFGTAKLAFIFSPVSCIWFLLLAGTGIYNITFYPGVFRALDPSRGIMLVVRTKQYDLLAGVLLAVTGCEAMFANLGQFNAASIRLSCCTFVYPGLILAYLGQGARLIVDRETVLAQVFYNSIPGPVNGPLFWITFTFAVFATLVASQAMITATFSLIQQVINSKAFPPLRMLYTSETIQSQVYVPAANWTLMIVTIILVAVFTNLTNLTNAYGFAVATMRYVKKLPVIVGIIYFIIFGFFDGLFWGTAFRKVPLGAWVPLMIGCILSLIMIFWVWAKSLEDEFDGKTRMNLRHFIGQSRHVPVSPTDEGEVYYYMRNRAPYSSVEDVMENESGDSEGRGKELQRIPSCAVFHKIASGKGVPHTFITFIRQWPALPRVVIFLSICFVPRPHVPVEERYAISKVRTVDGFYGATYYIGFRDKFDVKMEELIAKICAIERDANPSILEATINEISTAAVTATHIVPHYHVVSKNLTVGPSSVLFIINYLRALLIEAIYRRLATMFPETANWLTSADEIIRVGINAGI